MERVLYGPRSAAFRKAVRESKKDGRVRFVFPTESGFKSSTRRPNRDSYWTNGVEAGTWSNDHKSGIRDSDVEAFLVTYTVGELIIKASNGRQVRTSTVVYRSDGKAITFMEKMTAKKAIEQAMESPESLWK